MCNELINIGLLFPHQSKSSLQVKHFVKNNGHI